MHLLMLHRCAVHQHSAKHFHGGGGARESKGHAPVVRRHAVAAGPFAVVRKGALEPHSKVDVTQRVIC